MTIGNKKGGKDWVLRRVANDAPLGVDRYERGPITYTNNLNRTDGSHTATHMWVRPKG